MSEFLTKTLRWLNILVIFATFGAYLAPYVSPQTTWLFAVFGLVYPILLTFNFLFFFWWLWRKKLYCLYSLGCILLGWTHLSGLIGFNLVQPLPDDPITVMSYNTHSFRNLFPPHEDFTKQQAAFKKRLTKRVGQVEIMAFQEFIGWPETVASIKKTFGVSYYKKHSNSGTAIFSAYPIEKTGEIKFENTGNSCVWADLKTPKGLVRVYSVHLESVKISGDAAELRKDVDLRDKKTWSGVRKILGKYRRSTETRVNQTKAVTENIASCPHPVILCGDFNDTPISFVYQQMMQNLVDNFKEAGSGWGATYRGSIPMLRIDYIMTSKDKFKIYKHEILNEDYSDHYPIVSQMEIR